MFFTKPLRLLFRKKTMLVASLTDNTERNQIAGSLSGLAEIEAKQYSETVKEYLNNNKVRIKKTAFLALCKLDEESAYEFAFTNLNSSYLGLRNVIIEFLSHFPRQEVLAKARNIYQTGNYDLKKSMLKLFNKVGGWLSAIYKFGEQEQ